MNKLAKWWVSTARAVQCVINVVICVNHRKDYILGIMLGIKMKYLYSKKKNKLSKSKFTRSCVWKNRFVFKKSAGMCIIMASMCGLVCSASRAYKQNRSLDIKTFCPRGNDSQKPFSIARIIQDILWCLSHRSPEIQQFKQFTEVMCGCPQLNSINFDHIGTKTSWLGEVVTRSSTTTDATVSRWLRQADWTVKGSQDRVMLGW